MQRFPKVFQLGSREAEKIFEGPFEITEKVDGSQFNFGRVGKEIYFLSKGATIDENNPQPLFKGAVEHVSTLLESDTPEGFTFHGEVLQSPRHNILAYERIPKNHIALFGVMHHGKPLDYDSIAKWARILHVDCVPRIIVDLYPPYVETLKKILERDSFLGGTQIEGIVIKNYAHQVLYSNASLPLLAAKYVSEAFKESHKSWEKEYTGRGQWDDFVLTFPREARWNKAIQARREAGLLERAPRDIGPLLKYMHDDFLAEEKEDVKEVLFKIYGKDLMWRLATGFAQWYKEKLVGEMNEGTRNSGESG